MKKIFSLLCCVSFLYIGNVALGQTGGTAQIGGEIFDQANAEVQSIEVNFCGTTSKTQHYTFFAGQAQDICLEITSTAGKDILLSMDFVDGTLTNDQRKNRACMGNDQKQNFGQYVSGSESSFVVPARGQIIKHTTLMYPQGTKGDFLGCLVYYTKGVSLGGATDLNVLVRRAKFIDVSISQTFRYLYKQEMLILFIAFLLILLVKRRITHYHAKKRVK